MKKLIRQPLVHFFALGAALFILFGALNDDSGTSPGEIVVDGNRVEALAMSFERTWQRPPTTEEMRSLIDGWIREEVLYREGLALGLDQNDPVVRRRLAQKIEFMSDGGVRPPEESELEDWLKANAERYRMPPQFAFEQIFFSHERHGTDLPSVVDDALARLESGDTDVSGDATLLPGKFELSGVPQIGRTFGEEFAAGLEDHPVGEWAGPVRSSYGLHLVRIEQKEPGYLPSLQTIRAAVERDLLQERNARAKDDFYQALRDRYTVRIEAGPQMAGAAGED